MRPAFRHALLIGGLTLSGCTSFGQWLYDDPSFALRGVVPHPQPGADSLEISFIACNLNDYELTSEAFVAQLLLGGRPAGKGEREYPIHLGVRDSSRFNVMLGVGPEALEPGGEVPFAIAARVELLTPMGNRQVNMRLRGRVRHLKDRVEWREEGYGLCRPGLVALPPSFTERVEPSRWHGKPGTGRPASSTQEADST